MIRILISIILLKHVLISIKYRTQHNINSAISNKNLLIAFTRNISVYIPILLANNLT